MPGTMWEDLLGGLAEQTHVFEGDLLFRDAPARGLVLIHSGVVRVFLRTPPGRQVTTRYARAGDLLGVGGILGGTGEWNAEAIVLSTVEVVTVEQVQDAITRHPELPSLMAEHLAITASKVVRTVADSGWQPMAMRVAHHLREIARHTPQGRATAYISHQRLADAVGTVREVITRHLRALRAEGVIDTQPGRVVVLNDERLQRIAAGRSRPLQH
jgi:CRP/FNR family transcriptional regulator